MRKDSEILQDAREALIIESQCGIRHLVDILKMGASHLPCEREQGGADSQPWCGARTRI